MKVKLNSKEKQDLFRRERVLFEITHEGEPTPSRQQVRAFLKKELGTELFVIRNISSKYGFGFSEGEARVYKNEKDMRDFEPKYLMKRDEEKAKNEATPESAEVPAKEDKEKEEVK